MLALELSTRFKIRMTKYLLLFSMLFLIACGDSVSENVSPPVVEPPVVEPPVVEPPVAEPPVAEPPVVEPPVVEPPVVEPPVVEPPVVEPQKIVVNEHFPLDRENDVSLSPIIEISFDQNIDSKSDVELTLSQGNETVDGKLIVNNKQLLFTPQKNLQPEKTYTISLRSSASATNFIDLVEWEFTTIQQNMDTPASYFPKIQTKGFTKFLLQPIESVKSDELVRVSFGIPFPKGFLTDISLFKIVDADGIELPIATKDILAWQNDKSIRSVQVQLDVSFLLNEYAKLESKELMIEWGVERTTSDLPFTPVKDSWVLVDDSNYSADLSIYEPKAYAVFNPEWYGQSIIKNRLLPFHTNHSFSANDIAFKLFGDTAINHVDPRVTDENLIPFKESYASWLFDRAMTLYQLAFQSGEYKFLRAAHRASQFYLQNINEQGYFALKPSNDFKYSYGESLLANFILTGDERVPAVIEKMIPVWDSFKTEYTLKSNFWTERHAAYQLLGYITAYELLGTGELKDKVANTFSILRKMQIEPNEGIPITGALMHTAASHGEGGGYFIASPWMSTILVGAVERYYMNFEDDAAIDFVIKMADYFSQINTSLYEWGGYSGNDNYFLPHYLAGEGLTAAEHRGGGASDLEHAHDVTKIFSLAYYFSCKTACDSKYLDIIARLNNTVVRYAFPYWIRTSAPEVGKSAFRLSPPRKFSWWFQHTANNNFLLGNSIELPFHKPDSPYLKITQSHNAEGSVKPNDEVTFTYSIENLNSKVAKNVVVITRALEMSPNNLLDIVSMDGLGRVRGSSVVWKFDKIEPNTGVYGLTFTVKVKDLPVLQSPTRPIGDIVSYVDVSYCNELDDDSVCKFPQSSYDLGTQTVHAQSNWEQVQLIKAVTPPKIILNNIIEGDVLSGELLLEPQITDSDGIDHVEFYLDDILVKSVKSSPFEYTLQSNALSIGDHVLTVKAWDVFGSEGIKNVTFSSKTPDGTAPEVEVTSLVNNTACSDVHLLYSATDIHGVTSCEVSLNQEYSIISQCGRYTIPRITPLFSASAILTLEDNESINSTDGYSLIGTGTNVESINGYVDNGLFFGVEDSFVEFSQTHLDIHNEITVSFWMNPSADESVIISQDWYYIGAENGWAISLGANNHNNNNPLSITWSSGNSISNLNEKNIVQTPTNSIQLDTWQHVAVRKKDTLVDIFINGELIASTNISDASIRWPFNSDKLLSLGKAMNHTLNYSQYYKGALDEIAIWNEAISDSDIEQLYQRSPTLGMQEVTITAFDGAGNKGNTSVQFEFETCQ